MNRISKELIIIGAGSVISYMAFYFLFVMPCNLFSENGMDKATRHHLSDARTVQVAFFAEWSYFSDNLNEIGYSTPREDFVIELISADERSFTVAGYNEYGRAGFLITPESTEIKRIPKSEAIALIKQVREEKAAEVAAMQERLHAEMKSIDPAVRSKALVEMAKIMEEWVYPLLLQGIEDEDARNRRFAVWALGERQGVRTANILADVIRKDMDNVVRCGALQTLIEFWTVWAKQFMGNNPVSNDKGVNSNWNLHVNDWISRHFSNPPACLNEVLVQALSGQDSWFRIGALTAMRFLDSKSLSE